MSLRQDRPEHAPARALELNEAKLGVIIGRGGRGGNPRDRRSRWVTARTPYSFSDSESESSSTEAEAVGVNGDGLQEEGGVGFE
jgi:hypothetical protein